MRATEIQIGDIVAYWAETGSPPDVRLERKEVTVTEYDIPHILDEHLSEGSYIDVHRNGIEIWPVDRR